MFQEETSTSTIFVWKRCQANREIFNVFVLLNQCEWSLAPIAYQFFATIANDKEELFIRFLLRKRLHLVPANNNNNNNNNNNSYVLLYQT